jgi:hypothetical protein
MRSFAILVLAFVAVACEAKGPPPRVAEVPIDEVPPGLRTPVPVIVGGEPVGEPNPGPGPGGQGGPGAPESGGAAGGGGAAGAGLLPAMTSLGGAAGVGAGGPGAPAGATSSTRPLPPKAERLSAAECNKVMDKYIELVGISQGISPDAIGGVMSMLRNSVANDPNYGNALGACAKENTKTQYRCAMAARDVDTWNKCLK